MKLPTEVDVRLILAEDVRDEQGGKLSVIGMFPGDIKIASPGPNAVISSLAILWQVLAGEGKFKARIRLADPNGREMLDSKIIEIEKKLDGYANLIAKMVPFPVNVCGEFKGTLEIEGVTFTRSFKIVPA